MRRGLTPATAIFSDRVSSRARCGKMRLNLGERGAIGSPAALIPKTPLWIAAVVAGVVSLAVRIAQTLPFGGPHSLRNLLWYISTTLTNPNWNPTLLILMLGLGFGAAFIMTRNLKFAILGTAVGNGFLALVGALV